MDSLFPGIEDVEMHPPVLTLKFEKECSLPNPGDVVTDNKQYEMVVIDVDEVQHSVKVMIKSNTSIKEKHFEKRKELPDLIEEFGFFLHKNLSSGMHGLLLWEELDAEEKETFIKAVLHIINTLDDRGFIKFGPHNI